MIATVLVPVDVSFHLNVFCRFFEYFIWLAILGLIRVIFNLFYSIASINLNQYGILNFHV